MSHKFKGYKSGDKIGIDGSFDVNIWYSYDNDSKTTVISKKIDYNELVNIKLKDDVDFNNDTDIIVRILKQPTCNKVDIKDNIILFDIEKELGVEIVGDTKMKVSYEGEEDPWDDLDDIEDSIKEIDNVNENFI